MEKQIDTLLCILHWAANYALKNIKLDTYGDSAFFFNLQFADRTVAMSAIDMTSLLLEVSASMKQLYPSMPSKVLEALCYAIAGATMCIPHSHNQCVCVLQL